MDFWGKERDMVQAGVAGAFVQPEKIWVKLNA